MWILFRFSGGHIMLNLVKGHQVSLVEKIGLQVEVNVRYGSVIIDIGLKARLDV